MHFCPVTPSVSPTYGSIPVERSRSVECLGDQTVVRCAFVSHQPPISYHSSDDFQDKMLVSAVKQSEGLVFML